MTGKVQGSPDSMRTAGRVSANSSTVYGNQASTADAVSQGLSANKSLNNTKVMNSVQAIANGKKQLAEAHQKVSEMLPKVATAVEDAQRTEKAMNDAKTKLTAANKAKTAADTALQTAKTNLQSAELKLQLAQATPLTPTPASAGGSAPGPNPAAVAAAQAAVTAAKAVLVAATAADKVATTEQHRAQDTYTKDVKAFDQANTKRKAALTKLNNLYHEEAAKARAALTALGSAPNLAAIPGGLSEQQQLRNEITSLGDVDRLANDGELGEHAKQIEQSYNQSTSDNAATAQQGLNLMKLWGEAYDPTSIIPKANPAFVAKTTQLIKSATAGDPKALAQLRAQSSLSQQTEFSEALVLHIGAKNLEDIPLQLGTAVANDRGSSHFVAAQTVLKYLGTSLASASHSSDPQMAQFTKDLTATNGADTEAQLNNTEGGGDDYYHAAPGAGYWALGQLLGAATTSFSAGFLGATSANLAAFEKGNKLEQFTGPAQVGAMGQVSQLASLRADNLDRGHLVSSDPAYVLLHLASTSTASSRAVLDPSAANLGSYNAALGQAGANLRADTSSMGYLTTLFAHGTQPDGGKALAATLTAATQPNDAESANLLSLIVPAAATDYGNGTLKTKLSAVSQSLATILGKNMTTVNAVLFNQIVGGKNVSGVLPGTKQALLDDTQLLTVLGHVEQDPTAYKTLQSAELSFITHNLDATAGTAKFNQTLNEDANLFGTLILAKATVGQGIANATEEQKQKFFDLLSNGKDVLGDLGVEGKGLEITSQVLGFLQDNSSASTASTATGAQGLLNLPRTLQLLTVEALAKNGDLRKVAPTDPQYRQLNSEFIGKNGQLILPTTPKGKDEFQRWIALLKGSTGAMNSINNGLSAASELSGNESKGNDVGAQG